MKQSDKVSANKPAAPAEANSKITWDSPKLRDIEQTCRQTPLPPDTPIRERATKGLLKMVDVLRARLSEKERRELVESFDTMPVEKRGGSAFPYSLPEAMVIVLLESKDRDGLVTLLSKRFPPRIGLYTDIESELVSEDYKMKDSILILGEAYSKCKLPAMRASIAETVRHVFTGLGVRGKDDDEFVKNAMEWYEQNKEHLIINDGYASSVIEGYYEERPLFKKKNASPRAPQK